jgi:hypothetical protein
LTGRIIPDAIINAIKRMQGRQIDSQWLTKYASQLQQQFPEISNVVLDQMLASVDGVDVGNVQRLRLEQDERTDAHVELEVPMSGSDAPEVVAKPKIRLGDNESRRPATAVKAASEPPAAKSDHLTKSDLTVLKRVPRPDDREKQRLSA